MLKVAEWVLAGLAVLLGLGWLALLIGDGERATLQWISGMLTVVTLLYGLMHKRNETSRAQPPGWIKTAETAPEREAAHMNAATASGGDPLGRWWRRPR